jgi:hypothetical protein
MTPNREKQVRQLDEEIELLQARINACNREVQEQEKSGYDILASVACDEVTILSRTLGRLQAIGAELTKGMTL